MWDELCRCKPLRDRDIKGLMALGVSGRALAFNQQGNCDPIMIDRVELAGRRFEFGRYLSSTAETVNSYVVPIRDVVGDLVDAVAFRPDVDQPASWNGFPIVGAEQILAPRFEHQAALSVHETVMGWLCAERRGIVILEHIKAAGYLEGTTLIAATEEHAVKLRGALIRPAPRVMFGIAP